MNKFYLLLVLLLSSSKALSQNSFSDLEIFLCIGQSNMAGRAEIEAQDMGILNNVYLLNASSNWEKAENPLNRFSTIRGSLSAQKLGPAWTFGKTLQSYGKRVGLVVNAKGGTAISEWAQGTAFYNEAIARLTAAQSAGGTIKGIIWHQGESDQGNANYTADITAMIQAFRTDLGIPDLPFIAGEIGKWKTSATNINVMISELKNTINNVDYASASGLFHNGDGTHFNSESQRLFGARYAQKYLDLTGQLSSLTNTSKIIYKDGSGNLNYISDEEDNRIPDFSFAGYKSGEEAIPNVPVEVAIAPVSGDNRAHIQAAIDQVSAMPMVNGVRGAVLLQVGTYSVTGSIYIRDSGVVLRGEGNGTDPNSNTIIFSPVGTSTNNTDIIQVQGASQGDRFSSVDDIIPGSESMITNEFLPVNSRSFEVDNVSLYAVGDIICVYRQPEDGWLNMIDYGGGGSPPWSSDIQMVYPRKITAINGDTVIVDQPIYEHIFGNGITTSSIYKLNMSNERFISNVGIENLRITAGYNPNNLNEEFNARTCVNFDGVWDSWATDVVTENFWFTGFYMATTNRITLERCKALNPISQITGGRRYNFNMHYGANNILVKNAVATGARHAYVSNGTSFVSGIVFTQSASSGNHTAMEGHRRWTQGMLYDQITNTSSNSKIVLGLYNRGSYGTTHGWSASHSVAWNNSSTDYANTEFVIQKPPTSQNYAMFCDAMVTGNGPFPGDSGYFEGTQTTAPFASLYEAQLADRLANGVLPDAPARVEIAQVNGDLTISWLDNCGEEDAYVIEISTDGGTTYQPLATLAANTEQYVTPMNNATYDFYNSDFQIYATKGTNKSSRREFALETSVTSEYQVIEDAYTQGGTFGDNNYGSIDNILVKSGMSVDYSRNGYLKFDLSALTVPEDITSVLLNFYVYYSNKTLDFNVYKVADDTWSESTITWNTAPALSDVVASFATNGSVGGNYSLDVTNYVKASLMAGDTTISFGIYDDNEGDGHIRIYSKENTAGGQVPNLEVETIVNQSLSVDDFDATKYIVRQYPNPIRGNNVFFEFKLKSASDFNLSIFDLNGRLVKSVKKELYPGYQKIEFDADLNNGMYIYKLITDEFTKSGKVIVSR